MGDSRRFSVPSEPVRSNVRECSLRGGHGVFVERDDQKVRLVWLKAIQFRLQQRNNRPRPRVRSQTASLGGTTANTSGNGCVWSTAESWIFPTAILRVRAPVSVVFDDEFRPTSWLCNFRIMNTDNLLVFGDVEVTFDAVGILLPGLHGKRRDRVLRRIKPGPSMRYDHLGVQNGREEKTKASNTSTDRNIKKPPAVKRDFLGRMSSAANEKSHQSLGD